MTGQHKVPNLILRRIREEERQETRSEFAGAMLRKALELGESVSPSERYVARLEDGDVRYPHPAYRRVLAALCRRPMTELGFSSPHSAVQVIGRAPIADDSDQGSCGILSLSGPSSREIELVRLGINEIVGSSPMNEATIEDWEQTAIQHARATRYQSPRVIIAGLMADLIDLQDEMVRCRSASAMTRLTRVTAQMAGLMCLALVKLDEGAAFRRWARTARIAAGEAGDPATLSWVRAQEAYGYYYNSNIKEAIDIARHAQSVVHGTPCIGAALAAALEARAHAALGRRTETESALRQAEKILSALSPDCLIPSAFGYSEAQLRFHEGSAYTHLHDTKAAWPAQRRALELAPENDFTDRTLTHLDRAMCLAHDGDGTEAVGYATLALRELNGDQRQGIITLRAREVLNAIPNSQRALPPAREFRDFIVICGEEG